MIKTDTFWIPGPWTGQFAIASRPFGGEWLLGDMHNWRLEGVSIVVSLLTQPEIKEGDLGQQPECCHEQGMELISFPIWDRNVPSSNEELLELVHYLHRRLHEGKKIVIHCRAGVGRSAVVGACLLAYAGLDSETALQNISSARGCQVPDTLDQREWVNNFTRFLEKSTEVTLPCVKKPAH
jgi:protein-tyrosine phosphatase